MAKETFREFKERLKEVHRVGVCKCCDNWMRIVELQEIIEQEDEDKSHPTN